MTATRDSRYDSRSEYAIQVDEVEYLRRGNASWRALIYQPRGTGPFPMLLNVHGGAWSGGDKNSGKVVDEALAASGLVVVSIDLPIAPLYPYPGQVVHTNWATRWLKLNATDLNGDPRSVGGMGLSSGGHAIMLSALKPNDSRYAAIGPEHSAEVDATLSYVILRYPVLDPYVRYGYAKDVGREPLIRGTEGYFLTEEAMHEGNAQELLDRREQELLPPCLLVQGSADMNIPLSIPERFTETYQQAGGLIETHILPDLPHAFDVAVGPNTDKCIGLLKEFLNRQVSVAEIART